MSLLAAFLDITADWRAVFPQRRTWRRAVHQSLGSLVCLGRRCLTRIIWTCGGQHRSWSAEYFLHSRCRWDPQALFAPILSRALAFCSARLVGVAVDDTRLRKTGRSIRQAFYQRDPLSPPFHVNLVLGLRFLQASLLIPLHRGAAAGARPAHSFRGGFARQEAAAQGLARPGAGIQERAEALQPLAALRANRGLFAPRFGRCRRAGQDPGAGPRRQLL